MAIRLQSAENEIFEVSEAAALQNRTIKNMLEDVGSGAAGAFVPLPNVDSKTLSKVVDYCKYRADAEESKKPQDEIKQFEDEFLNVDTDTICKLMAAATYLENDKLLFITSSLLAQFLKGRTVEEMRIMFNVKNDFTPEEEAEIERENQWQFIQ